MASTESLHDQIIEAIVTSLSGIAGVAGTPGAVVGVDAFIDQLLDASFAGPIYAVRPGEEEHSEGETGNSIMRVEAGMDVFILCLQAYADDLNPYKQRDPPRRRVVDRMVKDVLQKLLTDVQLLGVAGGAVNNIFETPVIVDRDRFVPGWAVAEIHFRVSYSYANGTP